MTHASTSQRSRARRAGQAGMTMIEIMVVLAIVGGLFFIARTGFRVITRADLVEDATGLTAVFRRTSQLAVEHGEMHRVVIDLENHAYVVEVCQGELAIVRNEKLNSQDEDDVKRAIERGKQRLSNLPADAFAAGDPDAATKRALAVSGHHLSDRTCAPATDSITGDANGKGWQRKLRSDKGITFKQAWVQHLDDGVRKGHVAVYFFPVGSAEKAVVELTDGSDVLSVLVHGLTGRVELRDGALRDVNDHLLKNALGKRDAQREGQR
jgi:prepilin-type N-terminal cleavage/methylation domain-containing protein